MDQKDYLERFRETTDLMLEITTAKNSDYARRDDAFRNLMLVEYLGVCSAEIGVLVRMCDKISRMAQLMKNNPKVVMEKLDDTILDNGIYSVMLRILREARRNGTLQATSQIKED